MELSEAVRLVMDHPSYFEGVADQLSEEFLSKKFAGITEEIIEEKAELLGKDSYEFNDYALGVYMDSRVNQIIYIASKLKDAVDKESM